MNVSLHSLQEDFIAAYDEYADEIYRHCYFRTFDKELSLEIVQDAFLKTWEFVKAGGEIENVRAFLYRTATNIIVDIVRKNKRRLEESLEHLEESGMEFANNDDRLMKSSIDRSNLTKALNKIQEPYKSVIIMRHIEGMKPREIASVLNESVNVISVRITRGMEKLKSQMHNHD